MGVDSQPEIAREFVEAQVALLFVRTMATDTMRLQECLERFRPTGDLAQAQADRENQGNGER
jgi:hypothetical protein